MISLFLHKKPTQTTKKVDLSLNYKLYWQGKSPRVRAATEEFLRCGEPVKIVSKRTGVSIVSIMNRAKALKYLERKGRINLSEILSERKW